MAHPYLALRPNRNVLVSHYVMAGSKNPTNLFVGVSIRYNCKYLNFHCKGGEIVKETSYRKKMEIEEAISNLGFGELVVVFEK